MPNIDSHAPGTFCWFELATSDQEAAKKFYTSLFGYATVDSPMGPNEFYTMFKVDGRDTGAAYTLRAEQKAHGVPPHWALYISVISAQIASADAAELGATILVPAFDVMGLGNMAVIRDPTGAVFNVWEPKGHAGTGITGVDGSVCWADLNTPDPERASKFYGDLFDWKIAAGETDTSGYLHIQSGKDFIGGIPAPGQIPPGTPPHWMVYFQIADCDASSALVQQLGGRICMGPMTLEEVGRFAVVTDPQGAAFALFQPERH